MLSFRIDKRIELACAHTIAIGAGLSSNDKTPT